MASINGVFSMATDKKNNKQHLHQGFHHTLLSSMFPVLLYKPSLSKLEIKARCPCHPMQMGWTQRQTVNRHWYFPRPNFALISEFLWLSCRLPIYWLWLQSYTGHKIHKLCNIAKFQKAVLVCY